MDDGIVTDGGLSPDPQRVVAVDVQGAVVLNIAAGADGDVVPIAADDRAEPYAGIVFDDDVTDDHGGRSDKHVFADDRHLSFVWQNHTCSCARACLLRPKWYGLTQTRLVGKVEPDPICRAPIGFNLALVPSGSRRNVVTPDIIWGDPYEK
jgi:hypothetical protein